MLPSSSGGMLVESVHVWLLVHTCQSLLHLIQDEVHELVVAFECADNCVRSQLPPLFSLHHQTLLLRSLPPLNFTLICLSMYLLRSRIFSFFGRSVCPAAPPACAPPRPPPRPPRSPPRAPPRPPRNAPRSDIVYAWCERRVWAIILRLAVTCSSELQ
jgi:hypothetical protein